MVLSSGGEVLVVGSVNVDLVVRVAHLPAPGETVTGGAFTQHQGGKGANQAVAAARLGATVSLVGAVGDDGFGRGALVDLRGEGVDVSRVALLNGVPAGLALIMVDERGENQIAVASGANAALDGATVAAALSGWRPRPGAVLLTGFELGDGAILAAAQAAAARGVRLLVNPAPARPLDPELLALSPILLPNEGEATALTGKPDPRAAALALVALTHSPVIVTIGAGGALLVGADGPRSVEHVPAPSVAVVDTTGAGDAFAGALAAQLASGSPLAEAVQVAVRAASLSVGVAGARGGRPTPARFG
jgi:ribokinase